MMCAARNQIRNGKWLLCITVPAVTDVCRAQPPHSQVARFRFKGQPLQVPQEALRPTMVRQIIRTRFLIRKPGVERRAGHGFVVFPSDWNGQNNIRTFWIGKPLRTTSGAAGPKGISLSPFFKEAQVATAKSYPGNELIRVLPAPHLHRYQMRRFLVLVSL